MRSQKESIEVKVCDEVLEVSQSCLGLIAISSVVWDAGLLMVDFLSEICTSDSTCLSTDSFCNAEIAGVIHNDFKLGRTLDLGCGTGSV